MADYTEVKQILEEAKCGDEVLTTLGEIELPPGEPEEESPTVKVVVKSDGGKPVIMAGSLVSINNDPVYGGALLHIGAGFSDFPLDCPALAVSPDLSTG